MIFSILFSLAISKGINVHICLLFLPNGCSELYGFWFYLRVKGATRVSEIGNNAEFAEVNIEDVEMLEARLRDVDLVIHAAGPFQRAEKCTVLEAAIKTKVRNRRPTLMYVMIQAMPCVQSPTSVKHWMPMFQP